MDHQHGPDGEIIPVSEEAAAAVAETAVAETAADAQVKVAEIEAARDIELGKQRLKETEAMNETRLAELEGRVRGMEEVITRLSPPEPPPADPPAEPVVVEAPPEPVEPPAAETDPEPPPVSEAPKVPKKRKRSGWWG